VSAVLAIGVFKGTVDAGIVAVPTRQFLALLTITVRITLAQASQAHQTLAHSCSFAATLVVMQTLPWLGRTHFVNTVSVLLAVSMWNLLARRSEADALVALLIFHTRGAEGQRDSHRD